MSISMTSCDDASELTSSVTGEKKYGETQVVGPSGSVWRLIAMQMTIEMCHQTWLAVKSIRKMGILIAREITDFYIFLWSIFQHATFD